MEQDTGSEVSVIHYDVGTDEAVMHQDTKRYPLEWRDDLSRWLSVDMLDPYKLASEASLVSRSLSVTNPVKGLLTKGQPCLGLG